jgi:hypothetical protein
MFIPVFLCLIVPVFSCYYYYYYYYYYHHHHHRRMFTVIASSGAFDERIDLYYPLLRNPNTSSLFDEVWPLYKTLIQMNPVQISAPRFFKDNFNIIMPYFFLIELSYFCQIFKGRTSISFLYISSVLLSLFLSFSHLSPSLFYVKCTMYNHISLE